MTLKTKMSLLVFLTSLSIVSIGFSSWSITTETNAEIGGNIEVDNVINNNEYIKLIGDIPTCFKFGEKGFVDEKNRIIKNGTIEASYLIDLDMCYDLLSANSSSLSITINLLYFSEYEIDLDLFTSSDELSFGYTVNSSKYELSNIDTNENENLFSISFNLDKVFENYIQGNNETVQINVTYIWTINDSNYFYEQIFPELYDVNEQKEKIQFKIEAIVTN